MHVNVFFIKYKIKVYIFENIVYKNMHTRLLPKLFQFRDPNEQVRPRNEIQQSNKACSVAFTYIDFGNTTRIFCKR